MSKKFLRVKIKPLEKNKEPGSKTKRVCGLESSLGPKWRSTLWKTPSLCVRWGHSDKGACEDQFFLLLWIIGKMQWGCPCANQWSFPKAYCVPSLMRGSMSDKHRILLPVPMNLPYLLPPCAWTWRACPLAGRKCNLQRITLGEADGWKVCGTEDCGWPERRGFQAGPWKLGISRNLPQPLLCH